MERATATAAGANNAPNHGTPSPMQLPARALASTSMLTVVPLLQSPVLLTPSLPA